MAKMTLDDKLGLDRFYADEHHSHIEINETYNDVQQINLLVSACPAGLYSYENNKIEFNHEGCLECGTCRVLSLGKVIKSWEYPIGSKGVEFSQG